jgi:hypothetical protein
VREFSNGLLARGVVDLGNDGLGFHAGTMVRDPDGHVIRMLAD